MFIMSERADKLRLFEPRFDSGLLTLILELEHLRQLQISSTTHPIVFLQLKRLFHVLESVGSARIEGNNTTVAAYLEMQPDGGHTQQEAEDFKEIKNIEEALLFIEEYCASRPIDEVLIRELHAMVVRDLSSGAGGEGDSHAGAYREHSVRISGSSHTPPEAYRVPYLMADLLEFVNRKDSLQFDLIKIAQAHHRFVWIHPFGNGNGRTVRLFTYVMLLRAGFRVDIAGRIINPTAIFCSNREQYYHYLSEADKGTYEGMEGWCTYVLSGLRNELQKVNRLSDYEYLQDKILRPAIEDAWASGRIDRDTAEVLSVVARKQVVMNKDLKEVFQGKSPSTISRKIRELMDNTLITPEEENGRKYVLSLANRLLMPSVTKMLAAEGFLPETDL